MYSAQGKNSPAPAPTPPDGGSGGGGAPGTGTGVPGTQPPAFDPPKGLDPYQYSQGWQSGSSSQSQDQQGTSIGNTTQDQLNNNIYDPVSLALRGSGGNLLQQIMATGQLPGNFGISDQAFDALNRSFQKNIAPGMAAQYGAGSPAISSQQAAMNEQLAASMSQQQWSNFNNLFDEVANFAFTPTGQSTQQQRQDNVDTTQHTDQTGTWQQNNTMEGALLSSLLTALKGGGGII
jgi:hypothetical protein